MQATARRANSMPLRINHELTSSSGRFREAESLPPILPIWEVYLIPTRPSFWGSTLRTALHGATPHSLQTFKEIRLVLHSARPPTSWVSIRLMATDESFFPFTLTRAQVPVLASI